MTSIEDLVAVHGTRSDVWNYLFEYLDGLLFWKNPRAPRIRKGDLVGNQNTRYFSTFVCGKTVYIHKIIYEMHHGDYDGEVDHKDTDTYNNKIDNLRPATRLQNVLNVGLRRDNALGMKGVHFDKVSGKYIAQISVDGKRTQVGRFDTAELAKEAYDDAAAFLHEEFFRS